MAAVVRAAVDRALAEPPEESWQRALGAVGSGRSGRRDVSADHDRHLADAMGE